MSLRSIGVERGRQESGMEKFFSTVEGRLKYVLEKYPQVHYLEEDLRSVGYRAVAEIIKEQEDQPGKYRWINSAISSRAQDLMEGLAKKEINFLLAKENIKINNKSSDELTTDYDFINALDNKIDNRKLMEIIQTFPEGERQIFIKRYFEDKTFEQIAKELHEDGYLNNTHKRTCQRFYQRVLEKIRRIIREDLDDFLEI